MGKKLYRSEKDRMIGGVCGGLAEYFNIDPSIVRILFVFIVIYGGTGLLAYFILWIVLPTESAVDMTSDEVISENTKEIKEKIEKGAEGIKKSVSSDTKGKK